MLSDDVGEDDDDDESKLTDVKITMRAVFSLFFSDKMKRIIIIIFIMIFIFVCSFAQVAVVGRAMLLIVSCTQCATR